MSAAGEKKAAKMHKASQRALLMPIGYALMAAVCYALNTPLSKLLLANVAPTFMAAFLYLGAGLGVGVMYLFHWGKEKPQERLSRRDLPYTVGMIVLDILAPIFLMLGIKYGNAAHASLLGNFEIVTTTLIALAIFHEAVSRRLWGAIALITLSSALLSLEGGRQPAILLWVAVCVAGHRLLGPGKQLHPAHLREKHL